MKGKSKVMSGGFCLRDSKAEQRILQLLHIYCSNLNSCSSVPESYEPNPLERTLDLPLFLRYQFITSLRNLPYPAPSES